MVESLSYLFYINVIQMLKKLILITMGTIVSAAYADSGLYLGVGAGYANQGISTTNGYSYLDGSSSQSGGNMLGSVYLGYDFNHYLGIQSDYFYMADVQYTIGNNLNNGSQGSFTASQQLIDLGITGHLPFGIFANSLSGLSIFGKLALGYSFMNFSGGTVGINGNSSSTQNIPGSSQGLVPVIGGGFEYGIDSAGIRLEYDYIGNTPISNNGQSLMNANNSIFLLSALYHF